MNGRLTYSALAWLCVVVISGFYAWITLAPSGYPATPIVAVFVVGVVLAILKLGVRQPVDYWEAEPRQAHRVGLMVLAAVIIQFIASVSLIRSGVMTQVVSNAVYLGVWFGVPAIALTTGMVRWPQRRTKPRNSALVIVAGLAITFAVGLCSLQMMNVEAPQAAPASADVLIGGGAVLLGATLEEVVYRVLLLTALLKGGGSRLQALILSSAVFALAHVPPAFATPLALQDWSMLQFYATQFLPELVWIIGMGFVFGALWLRTGSITLIIAFHTICNLAPVLIAGTDGL